MPSAPRVRRGKEGLTLCLINGEHFECILSKSYLEEKGGIVAKWQRDSVSSKLPFGTSWGPSALLPLLQCPPTPCSARSPREVPRAPAMATAAPRGAQAGRRPC